MTMADFAPADWQRISLGELTASTRPICYGVLKPGPDTPGGVPLIRIQDLSEGTVAESGLHYISPELDAEFARSRLGGGEVLISIQGTIGRLAICPDSLSGANISRTVAVIRPDDRVSAAYLLQYLRLMEAASAFPTQGATRASLNIGALRQVVIPVPPPEVQARIVETLGYYLSLVERGDRSFREATEHIDQMRHAVLQSCWAGFQPERLGTLLDAPLRNGRSVPTADQGFPVLRLTALREGIIDTDESKIGAWTADIAEPFLIARNDFLVSRGNGSLRLVGKGGLVSSEPPPVAFPDTLIRIRPDEKRLRGRFLALVWNSHPVRVQLEERAHTSAGIYKVTQDMLEAIELPVPPIDEQDRLVAAVEAQQRSLGVLEETLRNQMLQADDLRRAVLLSAFRGELTRTAAAARSQAPLFSAPISTPNESAQPKDRLPVPAVE